MIGDTRYFRTDPALRAALEAAGGQAFAYSRKDGRAITTKLTSVPEADLDEPEALRAWAARALAVA